MGSTQTSRIPKPQRVLFCIPLHLATQFIVFVLLCNKITGLYGFLALFTGYELNFTQLSHYIYDLVTLALALWLSASIEEQGSQAVLKTMSLACLYIFDTAINTAYTFFFAASWFAVLAQHLGKDVPAIQVPGAGMINDTAGFTSPEVDASHVEVSVEPTQGLLPGQEATAVASTTGVGDDTLLKSGGAMSLTLIAIFLVIRLYCCLVVLSYARSKLRQHILLTSSAYAQTDDSRLAESPFRETREEGAGWQGKLGRALLRFPSRPYWLGMDNSDAFKTKAAKGRIPSSDPDRSSKKLES